MKKPGKMVGLALASVTQKPATRNYPFEKVPMPNRFRGMIKFTADKCIGCKLCVRDCPAAAIGIRKIADKQFECDIDNSKCIFCAQCVLSCPRAALESSPEYELAVINRDQLKMVYRGEPRPAAPADVAPKAETPAATASPDAAKTEPQK